MSTGGANMTSSGMGGMGGASKTTDAAAPAYTGAAVKTVGSLFAAVAAGVVAFAL
jgi:hypothetical protein